MLKPSNEDVTLIYPDDLETYLIDKSKVTLVNDEGYTINWIEGVEVLLVISDSNMPTVEISVRFEEVSPDGITVTQSTLIAMDTYLSLTKCPDNMAIPLAYAYKHRQAVQEYLISNLRNLEISFKEYTTTYEKTWYLKLEFEDLGGYYADVPFDTLSSFLCHTDNY